MNSEIFLALGALMFALMIALAIAAVVSKDLIKSAILLAGVSLIASFVFAILRAPDVAMAEASIGSALTALILVYAIRRTNRYEEGGGPE
jgi:uncharacterized MnhB-related membrane protein